MTGKLLAVSLAGLSLVTAMLAASTAAQAQQSRAEAEKDPVLKAMLAELDRNRNQPWSGNPRYLRCDIE